jgi:hypothetical protein
LHYFQMVLGINTDAPYLVPYYQQMANWYKPWAAATYHNNRIIIQFNGLVYLFSFGYYHIHTIFMCFLSLIGLTGIYKTFSPLLKNKTRELAFAVFLIPSVLFWGSGIFKEGILLFSIGMLIYHLSRFLFNKPSWNGFGWIVFSSAILSLTKIYVFVAFLPSFLSLILLKWTGNRHLFLKFLGVHLAVFILAVNAYRLNPEWDILNAMQHKQWSFTSMAQKGNAGSLIATRRLKPTTISLIKNTPEAIVNTLFRPYLFESKSLFMVMSAVENVFLISLVLLSFVFFKKPGEESLPLLYTSIFFVTCLALLIGIVNPVLGTIVRFRIPLLPFFVIFFIALLDKEKMIKNLPFLKFLQPKSELNEAEK